ncbi:MAG: PAS domain-containing protein [Methylococcaceae bacterium]|nr:PAS domain-containing protein [Methylococcaceae bacterium]
MTPTEKAPPAGLPMPQECEPFYRVMVETLPQGVFLFAKEGNLRFCNRRFAKMLGFPLESLTGCALSNIVHPDDRARLAGALEPIAPAGVCLDIHLLAVDRTPLPVFVRIWPLSDFGIDGIAGMVFDPTEIVIARTEMGERDSILYQLTKQVPGGIYQFQLFPDGHFSFPFVSEAVQTLFELTPRQVREDAALIFATCHTNDLEALMASIRHSAATLEPWTFEFRVVLPRQGLRWRCGLSKPERLADGSTLWHGILFDITERKQAQDELWKTHRELEIANNLLRGIIDGSSELVAALDTGFNYLTFNRAYRDEFQTLFGSSIAIGSNMIGALAHLPEEQAKMTELWRQALRGESFSVQQEFGDPRRVRRSYEFSFGLIRGAEGSLIGAAHIARDTSERLRAQQALQRSDSALREAQRVARLGSWVWNLDTDLVQWSEELYAIIGLDPKAPLPTCQQMHALCAPEDWEKLKASWERSLREGIAFDLELELIKVDGGKVWVTVKGEPLFDPDGRVGGLIGTCQDIGDVKRAQRRLEQLLLEKEILLREVHHRVKNNLQAMIYLMDFDMDKMDSEQGRQVLRDLQQRSRAMALIYESLYQSPNLAEVAFDVYLQELSGLIQQAFVQGRNIELSVQADPVRLKVDMAVPCGMIVNELVGNALKYAFPPRYPGSPCIAVLFKEEKESYSLIVSDNGIGLPKEVDWNCACASGLKLVRLWATHQMGGEIELIPTEGTRYHLRFPKN